MRLTYNAFGVCYIGLSPYTLPRENGRVVRVYALRDAEKGRVEVKLVAANKGNKVNSNDPFGNYMAQGDTAWGGNDSTGSEARKFFGDTKSILGYTPDTQLYKYSMIYNCDRSNTTLNKSKDLSYALVYIYDDNSPELMPEGDFDTGDFEWINK